MTKIQFLEKYNKLLILLQTNEDEEPNENQESLTYNIKKPNDFNLNKIIYKNNLFSKQLIMDVSIENINLNNIRDLIKKKNDFNNNLKENLKIENNHSEILASSNKHSQNNEENSILEAGNLLKEINFTDSGASTFKEKFDNKFGSIIKPTNTFNNKFAQNIEYQLDLEKAKIKQRFKDGNNFNLTQGSRQPSFNNIASIMNSKNFGLNYLDDKYKNNDLISDLKRDVRKKIFLGNQNNKNIEKYEFDSDIGYLNHHHLIPENNNNLPGLKIEENNKENKELIDEEIKTQADILVGEAEISKTPNKININFTNYGVINNNLVSFNIPKSNRLNNKMLDILKEITLSNTKQSKTSIYDLQNINNKTRLITNDLNKNNIIDSILNNNINNLQNSLNKNYIEMNPKSNENKNFNFRNVNIYIKKELNKYGNENDYITSSAANKIDYFSEIFKLVDDKKYTKSLSERINQLKKKNNFLESGIKGVNNTNNVFNINLKYSNMDKVLRNNKFNVNSNNLLINRTDSQTQKRNNTNSNPKLKSKLLRNSNTQYESSNINNFYVLEAQLDSLKNKSNRYISNFSKINRVSSESINLNINNLKNSQEKTKF